MTGQHPDDHADQPLRDCRIAIRREYQHAIPILRMQPDLRLATLDQVIIRLILFFDLRQILSQLDDLFIFIHPVAE